PAKRVGSYSRAVVARVRCWRLALRATVQDRTALTMTSLKNRPARPNPEPLARTPQPVPTRAPPPSTTPDKQKAAGSWFRALRVRGGQSPHNHGATTPYTRFARDSPSESGPRPRP